MTGLLKTLIAYFPIKSHVAEIGDPIIAYWRFGQILKVATSKKGYISEANCKMVIADPNIGACPGTGIGLTKPTLNCLLDGVVWRLVP